MPYNISEDKVTEICQMAEKLQRLSPYALAYVEGAVNMAVMMTTGQQSA